MEIDEKIIRKAIEKDEHAINLIYENTLNTAYFIAKHYACNQNTVNDILQESYIKVFANLNNLKDSSKLQSWINAIVRNKALDYNRKNERESVGFGKEWDKVICFSIYSMLILDFSRGSKSMCLSKADNGIGRSVR